MKKLSIAIVLTALILAGGFGLSGCNTMRGIGKDVQAAGRSIERVGQK
jgi:predicted small secreted protein